MPAVLAPVAVGQVPVAGASDAVQAGDFVYVGGANGVSVFNVTGAAVNNPQFIRTVGSKADLVEVHGNLLVAVRGGLNPNSTKLDTYSLADPSNPQLLGSTGEIPYSAAAELTVTDTHAFVVLVNLHFFTGSNDIFDQTGGLLSIDISNPSAPVLDGDAVIAKGTAAGRDGVNDGVLFNANGTTNDGVKVVAGIDESGGNSNTWAAAQGSPTIVYVTGSTATGGNTQAGTGVVHVVDISDGKNPHLLRDVTIPGTVQTTGIAVNGNRAFVIASQGGWNDQNPDLSFTGQAVAAVLDLSDSANPQVVRTRQLAEAGRGVGRAQVVALGDGRFAYGNQGSNATDPGLFVADTAGGGIENVGLDVPAEVLHASGGSNRLYTADGSNLVIYSVPPRMTPTASKTVLVGFPQFAVGSDVGGGTATLYNADQTVRFSPTPFVG